MKYLLIVMMSMSVASSAFAWGGGRVTGAACSKCDCDNATARCMTCCSDKISYSSEKEDEQSFEPTKTAEGPAMDADEAAAIGDNPSA